MENRHKYHFDDFTLAEYRELLLTAKKNYTFRNYTNFKEDERFILWRHDVDFSMHAALKLAQIEQQEGIQATYFVLPHCEYYNLFEREITDLVKSIIALGHRIGLHFDSHYYNITNANELELHLKREQRWLEEIFGTTIDVFSFHNTSEFTMSCQEWKYGGLINTYAAYFQTKVGYCSDSNGHWRFKRLKEVLSGAEYSCLQILTHPEWWREEVMSPRQKIQFCIDGRAQSNAEFYDALMRRIQRDNIDWQ